MHHKVASESRRIPLPKKRNYHLTQNQKLHRIVSSFDKITISAFIFYHSSFKPKFPQVQLLWWAILIFFILQISKKNNLSKILKTFPLRHLESRDARGASQIGFEYSPRCYFSYFDYCLRCLLTLPIFVYGSTWGKRLKPWLNFVLLCSGLVLGVFIGLVLALVSGLILGLV